jgi:hypothetical protein
LWHRREILNQRFNFLMEARDEEIGDVEFGETFDAGSTREVDGGNGRLVLPVTVESVALERSRRDASEVL